jgi:hypothetical protein
MLALVVLAGWLLAHRCQSSVVVVQVSVAFVRCHISVVVAQAAVCCQRLCLAPVAVLWWQRATLLDGRGCVCFVSAGTAACSTCISGLVQPGVLAVVTVTCVICLYQGCLLHSPGALLQVVCCSVSRLEQCRVSCVLRIAHYSDLCFFWAHAHACCESRCQACVCGTGWRRCTSCTMSRPMAGFMPILCCM